MSGSLVCTNCFAAGPRNILTCRDEDTPFCEGVRAELELLHIAVAAQRSCRQVK